MTDTINEARALLARWAAVDPFVRPQRLVDVVSALVADLEAARAELAAARAAMPTSVEWLALTGIYSTAVDHVTECGEHRPTPNADRELDAVLGWFNRRNAYHAAHPAASSDGTGRAGGGGS